MAHVKKIKGRYYAYYKGIGGKRESKSLNTSNPTIAKRRLKDVERLEYEISIGLMTEDPHQTQRKNLDTIGKIQTVFLKDQRPHLEPSTYESYRRAIDKLGSVLGVDRPLSTLNSADLSVFIEFLENEEVYEKRTDSIKRKYSPVSINIMLRSIKRFLNWCVENDYLDKLPFKVKQLKVEKASPKFMTDDQVDGLFKAMESKPHIREVFMIYLATGIRLGELNNSKITPDGSHIILTRTKGHSERIVPLPSELKASYIEALKRQWNMDYLSKEFRRFARIAGLPEELKFHSLRHTYAVRHWVKYKDIYLTKEFLGHSTVNVTEKYANIPSSYLEEVIKFRECTTPDEASKS